MTPATRATARFFGFTFAVTFALQLPAVLAHHGVIAGPPEKFMPLVGLGAFGPTFGAILAARGEQGPRPVRAVFAQLGRWRVHPIWWLVALFTSGALFSGAMAILSLFVQDIGPLAYPPNDAQRLVALVFFPIGEEIGWRGFALPRLQERFGPLRASILLGTAWCAWHAMMFELSGFSLVWLVILAPFFIGGSVFFTWLWNRTGGSLLLAVLAHVGAHLDNSNRPLPGNATPALVHTAAFVLFAIALVALDRKVWLRPQRVQVSFHERHSPPSVNV